MEDLRDQETDEERCLKPEYMVVIGICTHLGCVPLPDTGDYNGCFCPCHGWVAWAFLRLLGCGCGGIVLPWGVTCVWCFGM